jgi:hypothetical protein
VTEDRDQDDVKTPLSFKIMIVLVALYLGWRLIQVAVSLWQWMF